MRRLEIRSYVSEPDRGWRDWDDKEAQRDAVYANRRRVRGKRGKELMRKRGELIERSFAHIHGNRRRARVHLKGRVNILKRMLIQVGGFDLSLVMRKLIGIGKPRGLQGFFSRLFSTLFMFRTMLWSDWRRRVELGTS